LGVRVERPPMQPVWKCKKLDFWELLAAPG
jgi:hypothetical protein